MKDRVYTGEWHKGIIHERGRAGKEFYVYLVEL
jgi:hypothetical protein